MRAVSLQSVELSAISGKLRKSKITVIAAQAKPSDIHCKGIAGI